MQPCTTTPGLQQNCCQPLAVDRLYGWNLIEDALKPQSKEYGRSCMACSQALVDLELFFGAFCLPCR